MFKETNPILSDEFLDCVVKEINKQYGGPMVEQMRKVVSPSVMSDTQAGMKK